uniref:Uncharacterized protein n=1 Tax=Physcomitrium patens TaxID=3218 RepID=A0A2K1JMI9_PHYPA|nr:hypothetical protein PHYPA_017584 [Physcomitrium patens]
MWTDSLFPSPLLSWLPYPSRSSRPSLSRPGPPAILHTLAPPIPSFEIVGNSDFVISTAINYVTPPVCSFQHGLYGDLCERSGLRVWRGSVTPLPRLRSVGSIAGVRLFGIFHLMLS